MTTEQLYVTRLPKLNMRYTYLPQSLLDYSTGVCYFPVSVAVGPTPQPVSDIKPNTVYRHVSQPPIY